jgi:tetratricopeptide (TPR) repeat protein
VQQGKSAAADQLAARGLRLALRVGQAEAAGDIVLSRAEAATSAGRTDEAAIHLSYFEAVAARIHDPEEAAIQSRRARIVRGLLHLRRGEPGDALALLAPMADDPQVEVEKRITALGALGAAYEALGRADEAIAAWTRLVALVEAEQGPDAAGLVGPLNNLAAMRITGGELDAALEDLARAEAIAMRALGAEHPFVAGILTNRGLAERERGRLAEAQDLQERSLALRTRIHGDAHPSLAHPLDELGELARRRGEHAVALAHLERARRLREEGLGPEHPLVADTLLLEARVQLDMGEAARAQATLERALGIVGRHDGDPVDRAEVELLLARATENRDPMAARGLALAAEDHAGEAGDAGVVVRDEARAWLAAHPAAVVGANAPR